MNLGIFGGTFNPVHLAHLRVAEEVREACALDQVLFLPASVPPHKHPAAAVSFADRCAMVEAAIADHPDFRLCAIEGERPGKSYSVDTLELLRQRHPGDDFYFIIGLDSFRDLPLWHDYARLFTLTHIVVATRPGVFSGDPRELLPVAMHNEFCYDCGAKTLSHRSGTSIFFVEETRLDISSTQIRHLVDTGRSTRYLVPPTVADYIAAHGLYREQER
ncbi:MAG: nicotinate-nucleotide adenylyltransferase [Trichloromonadaceae bacterium]